MIRNPNHLVLVRHGHNEQNSELANAKLPLSDQGIDQSIWASEVLAKKLGYFDTVLSSPAIRAVQTASIISKSSEIKMDERLLERGWYKNPYGQEKASSITFRATAFLDDLKSEYADRNVLVVGHGGLLKTIKHILENQANERELVENCSIAIYSKIDPETKHKANYLRFKQEVFPFKVDFRNKVIGSGNVCYFVRHGESESNSQGLLAGGMDFPLTTLGVEQAVQVADYIAQESPLLNRVFSSPLSRALDTAKEIARKANLKKSDIVILDDLRGCGGGSLEGRPYSEWYSVPEDELVSKYGAESYSEQRKRIGRAAIDIVNYTNKTSPDAPPPVIVSHSSVFQVMQSIANNVYDEKAVFQQPKPRPGECTSIVL